MIAKAATFAIALRHVAPTAAITVVAEVSAIPGGLDSVIARANALLAANDEIVVDEAVAEELDARFLLARTPGGWRLISSRVEEPKAAVHHCASYELHKLGLAFLDWQTEAEFREWYARSAPPFVRAGMLMTLIGWLAVLVWNTLNNPPDERTAFFRFIGVGMLPSALCLMIGLFAGTRRWLAAVATVANMLTAGLILFVGFAMGPPPGPATHGIIFLTYFAFVVLRLELRQALWSSLSLLCAYYLLLFAPHTHLYRSADRDAFTLALGIVPVATAFATAMLIGAALSRTSRRGYRDERMAEVARRVAEDNRAHAEQLEREAGARELAAIGAELRRQLTESSRDLVHIASSISKVAAAPRLAAGDSVDQRYRVIRRVGEGGMGRVYEIERLADGKRLALKVLLKLADPSALARFAREAQIAARLEHPNVVAAVDLGFLPTGSPFVVMELVPGASLADLRHRYGDLAWALRILSQVADALAAMHEARIVHRDLKPANILVTENCVKVTDFGISRVLDEKGVAGPLTRSGVLMGTPWYMAPELAVGAHMAKPSSDVFSFGVLAYELVARALPYESPPVLAFNERPLRLSGVRPDLAQLVDDCLVIRHEERPSSAELARSLKALVEGHDMPPRQAIPSAVEVLDGEATTEGTQPAATESEVSQEREAVPAASEVPESATLHTLEAFELGTWGLRFSHPVTEQRFIAHAELSSIAHTRTIMLATVLVWTSSVLWAAFQWREGLAPMLICASVAMLPVFVCIATTVQPIWQGWLSAVATFANVMNGLMAIIVCFVATESPLVATHICVWFCYFGLIGLRLRFTRGLLATMPFLLIYQTMLALAYDAGNLERHLIVSESIVIWLNFVSAVLAAGVFARVMRLGFRQDQMAAVDHEAAARMHGRVERLQREAVASQLELIGTEIRRHVAERSARLVERLANIRIVSAMRLEIGEIVDGRYQIDRLLGEGSMGRVYRVIRLADKQAYALKVMIRPARGTSLRRFARESPSRRVLTIQALLLLSI